MKTRWLCLDFSKTVAWDVRDSQVERLGSYADLVAWFREGAWIDARTARELLAAAEARPGSAARVLRKAIQVRALTYAIFKRFGAGGSPAASDLESLNTFVAATAPYRRIVPERGAFSWGWRPDAQLQLPLAMAVWSAVELLTADELARVKLCASDGCGWLFVDGSRNRSRRWCAMNDCGNREKAVRFRSKRRRRR